MIWLFGLLAMADESLPDLWTQLHEGEIAHFIDGKPQEAIEIYEALFKDLPPDHPLFGQILFALGRAYYDIGKKQKAKEALLRSIRSPEPPETASAYYIDMLASEYPIQSLPYSGNVWFSLSDSEVLPKRYKIHLEEEAQQFTQVNLTLDILKEGKIYVCLEETQGKIIEEVIYLKKGRHNLRIQGGVFPKAFSGKSSIEGISLESDKEGILSASNISIR